MTPYDREVANGQEIASGFYDGFYHWHLERESLWVLPPKCASSSIRWVTPTAPIHDRSEMARLNAKYFTVGVVRHPLARVLSALMKALPDLVGITTLEDKLTCFRTNCHVRPQARAFEGLRIDHWIRFEHLVEDWAKLSEASNAWRSAHGLEALPTYTERLPHMHRQPPYLDWRTAIDWTQFLPWYEDDWKLNPEWERP